MNALGLAALGYALFTAAIYLGQRKFIYPSPQPTLEPGVDDADLVMLQVPEVGAIPALHFAAAPGAPTVVHFHGNGEQLAEQVGLARAFSSRGLGVFAVEYPGYGVVRDLHTTEAANYRTAEQAILTLTGERGVPAESLVLQGHSLGTGIATEMAARGYGRGLVLIAPFTSMVDMARRTVPIIPNHWLVKDRYENQAKAPQISIPTLIIHGTRDEVIPLRMGIQLSETLPNAELCVVEDGAHNDLFVIQGQKLTAQIDAFARGVVRAASRQQLMNGH